MSEENQHRTPRLIRFCRWIWRFWKERSLQRFVSALEPQPSEVLLDIGGYSFNWFRRGNIIASVDVLNLEPSPIGAVPPGTPEIRSLSGDVRKLGFTDRSYDIVFSNSVIEHVGTFADQMAFASEARRVGRKLWIQTPARACPIEPHYMGVFIHWFPASWHVCLARWTHLRCLTRSASRRELAEIAATTRLLNKREFSDMFPDCEIWTERLLGILPKSYVAIRSDLQPDQRPS